MPKVYHLTDTLPYSHPAWGGAEQLTAKYISALRKRAPGRHYVICLFPSTPEIYQDAYFIKSASSISKVGQRLADLIHFDPISCLELFKLFSQLPANSIIHIHNCKYLFFPAIFVNYLTRIRIVMSIYDYWIMCPKVSLDRSGELCISMEGRICADCYGSPENQLKQTYHHWRRKFLHASLRQISMFHVLSRSSGDILQKSGISKRKIKILPQIVEYEQIDSIPPFQFSFPTILFSGWMDQKKGLHIAIDAFGKIASSHPTARLIVAKFKANESYEAQIRARINELGLQERVLFFDRLKRNEFIAFLKGCDCLIIPEQWENMSPVVLCEAMYASKPVIASKVGGIPEFISDGYSGILVERNDVNGFAHAMDSLLSSETKRLVMGNNARQAAEAIFDETRILDGFDEIYRKAFHGKK